MTTLSTPPTPPTTAASGRLAAPRLWRDTRTMVRRSLLHIVRYPSMTLMLLAQPVLVLLLFVYVYGGALSGGLTGTPDRAAYLDYVVPGILAFTLSTASIATAVSVAMDQTQGFIDRVRTMPVARSAIISGRIVAAVVQSLLASVILLVLAVVLGFRPTARAAVWLVLIGLVVLVALALSWLSAALGLAADSVEAASNSPMPIMLLPLFGSGFVPTATMPGVVRAFADHQPFTPLGEAMRGLLAGAPDWGTLLVAVAWFVGIGVLSMAWALRLYSRPRAR